METNNKMENKCVLCGEPLPKNHPGLNNPWPLAEEGNCCDKCNVRVLVERIKNAVRRKK